MNSSKLSRLITIVLIFAVALTSFSCNRGYGCPNNFSLDEVADLAQRLLTLL